MGTVTPVPAEHVTGETVPKPSRSRQFCFLSGLDAYGILHGIGIRFGNGFRVGIFFGFHLGVRFGLYRPGFGYFGLFGFPDLFAFGIRAGIGIVLKDAVQLHDPHLHQCAALLLFISLPVLSQALTS